MIQRLTPLTSPVQIGANDESAVVASASEGYMLVVCMHCGNLRSAYVLFTPGKTMNEFAMQKEVYTKLPRCLCPKREVSK